MSTVVVTLFPTSDAYKSDLSIANEGLKLISACEGVLANYHGIQMEDNNVGYGIQVATTPEAFLAVVNNKEQFGAILEKLSVTRASDAIDQNFFVAISDPFKALAGPVTEVSFWSLKDPTPENKQTFDTIFTEFNKLMEGKLTYGWSGADPNKAIVIAAWDSVEAHSASGHAPDAEASLKTAWELCNTHGGPFQHVKLLKE